VGLAVVEGAVLEGVLIQILPAILLRSAKDLRVLLPLLHHAQVHQVVEVFPLIQSIQPI
jgi:hypothetical protein